MAADPKRIWVFANGDIPDLERLRALLRSQDRFIAADRGYHWLRALGLAPECVIGDLDSLLPEELVELSRLNVPLVRYPVDKNETDLELAIDWGIRAGCDQLFIAGALGGRLDQSLGNLFLLARPELSGLDVRLEDGTEQVFLIRERSGIQGRAGDTVSLLPLGAPVHGVITEGLKYPLGKGDMGETLYPDRTRGISNVLLADQASVRIADGILICILRRRER